MPLFADSSNEQAVVSRLFELNKPLFANKLHWTSSCLPKTGPLKYQLNFKNTVPNKKFY